MELVTMATICATVGCHHELGSHYASYDKTAHGCGARIAHDGGGSPCHCSGFTLRYLPDADLLTRVP